MKLLMGEELITSTAVSQQRANKLLWLHIWGLFMLSIFIHSLFTELLAAKMLNNFQD